MPDGVRHRLGDVSSGEGSVRVDSWIWAVRLMKTRSMAATACRAGHVRVNGARVKPAHAVRPGDEVRLRHAGRERIVVVSRLISKRVGAPVAAECYQDNTPAPPPREEQVLVAVRDRGMGRPSKRDRRELARLRELDRLRGVEPLRDLEAALRRPPAGSPTEWDDEQDESADAGPLPGADGEPVAEPRRGRGAADGRRRPRG